VSLGRPPILCRGFEPRLPHITAYFAFGDAFPPPGRVFQDRVFELIGCSSFIRVLVGSNACRQASRTALTASIAEMSRRPGRGRPAAARGPAGSPTGRSTTSTAMTGPGAACAASTRSPKPDGPFDGHCSGQTKPVHQTHRGDQEHRPRPGGQDPQAGGLEGLHHQPPPSPPTS
jgi:hypothetical protein